MCFLGSSCLYFLQMPPAIFFNSHMRNTNNIIHSHYTQVKPLGLSIPCPKKLILTIAFYFHLHFVVLLVLPLSPQTQTHILDKIFKAWKQTTSPKNDMLLTKLLQKCPSHFILPFPMCVSMCAIPISCTSGHFLGVFHE